MKGASYMKKILIFSDTHGYTNQCIDIIKETDVVSTVIHAGDYVRDAEDLASIFPNIPMYYVKGNNDIFSDAPMKMNIEIGGKRIFITHGHEYRVKYEADYRTLVEKGRAENADLTVFGHTHIPYTSYEGKMTVINPGSVIFSKTYAVAEIDGDRLKTRIVNI